MSTVRTPIINPHSRWTPAMIRALRKHNQLSQQNFAVLLGVTLFTVSRWERGVSKPSNLVRMELDHLHAVGLDQYRLAKLHRIAPQHE